MNQDIIEWRCTFEFGFTPLFKLLAINILKHLFRKDVWFQEVPWYLRTPTCHLFLFLSIWWVTYVAFLIMFGLLLAWRWGYYIMYGWPLYGNNSIIHYGQWTYTSWFFVWTFFSHAVPFRFSILSRLFCDNLGCLLK